MLTGIKRRAPGPLVLRRCGSLSNCMLGIRNLRRQVRMGSQRGRKPEEFLDVYTYATGHRQGSARRSTASMKTRTTDWMQSIPANLNRRPTRRWRRLLFSLAVRQRGASRPCWAYRNAACVTFLKRRAVPRGDLRVRIIELAKWQRLRRQNVSAACS